MDWIKCVLYAAVRIKTIDDDPETIRIILLLYTGDLLT